VREISMAKLYAARVAVEVADECIQIHGGAGYMKEYGIERVWRDMRLNRIGAGTDEIMLEVIGRSYGLYGLALRPPQRLERGVRPMRSSISNALVAQDPGAGSGRTSPSRGRS
jgi:hypothetical protein